MHRNCCAVYSGITVRYDADFAFDYVGDTPYGYFET